MLTKYFPIAALALISMCNATPASPLAEVLSRVDLSKSPAPHGVDWPVRAVGNWTAEDGASHLESRQASAQYDGWDALSCRGRHLNSGRLATNICWTVDSATQSWRPSGANNCVIQAYTCQFCQCAPTFSGWANDQCIQNAIQQPSGHLFVYNTHSVSVHC